MGPIYGKLPHVGRMPLQDSLNPKHQTLKRLAHVHVRVLAPVAVVDHASATAEASRLVSWATDPVTVSISIRDNRDYIVV